MLSKINLIYRVFKGEFLKLCLKWNLLPINKEINKQARESELIVSLTSYGRRVKETLPYTLKSLMRQTLKPDRIILWLDYDNWNENNIPKELIELRKKGLTIQYCEDIKSFKKLIPTLENHPNSLIFTADDDIYYPKDILEKLYNEYLKDKNKIYALRGYKPTFNRTKELMPYNNWQQINCKSSGKLLFSTSGAGVLFQKRLLFNDICNKDLFMKLCPSADDIWFFFMEYLNDTEIVILSNIQSDYVPLDALYQHFHTNSSLSSINCGESQNDIQIRNVMNHYNLTDKDLYKTYLSQEQ